MEEITMIEGRRVQPCLTLGNDSYVWLQHINNPDTWDLVDREKQYTGDKFSSYRRHVYGWVEKKWNNRIHAGGPAPYDEETDSDAWGEDDLIDIEAAMKLVEERFSFDLHI